MADRLTQLQDCLDDVSLCPFPVMDFSCFDPLWFLYQVHFVSNIVVSKGLDVGRRCLTRHTLLAHGMACILLFYLHCAICHARNDKSEDSRRRHLLYPA